MMNQDEASTEDVDKKSESKLTQTFLNLERIDPLLYRSTHLFKPVLGRAVFGGQVVGQALVAASNTAPAHRNVHSLHCYFLRPGNIDHPILYHVQEIRDGGTYSNRFVNATQQGKSMFTMMVSFKVQEEDEFEHQFIMPDVPPPEECTEMTDLLRERLGMDIGEKERDYIQNRLSEEMTILRKPVDPAAYFGRKPVPARQLFWLKVKDHIGSNQQMQNCAAAYVTDAMLIGTSTLPSGRNYQNFKFFMVSLDHAIWFHHPVKIDEWHLYEMESPQCGSARCMNLARTWSRQGKLIMSVAQEGVCRTISPKSGESTRAWSNVVKGRNSSDISSTGRSGTNGHEFETTAKSSAVAIPQHKNFGRLLQLTRKILRFVR